MTTDEALGRLRGLLNEPIAGFYTDGLLYSYLDSGQMEVISICRSKQDFLQKTDKEYECVALQSLIEHVPGEFDDGETEYALPENFLFTYSLMADVSNTGTERRALPLSYSSFLWKEDNLFSKATATEPRYYIKLSTSVFGVKPAPSEGGAYTHSYYKKPETIDEGIELALRPETHEAIVYLAYSRALEQGNKPQEAHAVRNIAINLIKDL